ncbi:hypothetical protein [Legionella cincinnatiensis]|uniref:Uncharacterized protein n=1 Tax=Legionella cincinnatiensis TaxID=28085 RepID=A0A378IHU2_9GAMM|nr:hypothetical protein [Legionella cincinnatiensis]HCJ1069202.1 hypothetical protein [Legionella pneumophila]KTC93598.1 hypothetical protein Lcin_0178 [Legionella cincinnatiensis]STX34071.1 Uncharacterised protein [Legionella cincinnatiensis]HDI4380907.1 hypothetical protein [Legionella pneumophila]HDI4384388.1 hypothetical protein [Legionella pneumophila]
MPIGVLFWVLMLVWLLFGLYWHRTEFSRGNYGIVGGNIMLFILLAIIGWKVFGPILH